MKAGHAGRPIPAEGETPSPAAGKRLAWRIGGGVGLAALVGWLLLLDPSVDGDGRAPHLPFDPQDTARQCAVEAGIAANRPGQVITAAQREHLEACMDREIARSGSPR